MYNCGLSALSMGLIPSLRFVDVWGEVLGFITIKCCLDLSLSLARIPVHLLPMTRKDAGGLRAEEMYGEETAERQYSEETKYTTRTRVR